MISFSPSKINIGLNIVDKRTDNYHNIQSIFIPLPFYDIIEIVKSSNFSYHNSGIKIDCDLEKNTCIKAYQLLLNDFSIIKNIHIFHHKIIPTGMGLGAGSANAIIVLKSINELFNLEIKPEDFKKYAEKIGSDCAFFLQNTPSYISGKGDIIKPIKISFKGYKIIILLPKNITINTTWAYSKIVPKNPSTPLLEAINQPILTWKDNIVNDFEKPVFEKFPVLKITKKYLYEQGALFASMSGSGASLFGIFEEKTIVKEETLKENFTTHTFIF